MDLKDSLALAGVAAGYLSFFRLLFGDLLNWRKKPRLAIEFDPEQDLRQRSLFDKRRLLRIQKVVTVHVRNKRRMPPLRCVAILSPVSVPQGVTLAEKEWVLHWADTDYTSRSNVAEPVDIGPERRRLDVVFTVSDFAVSAAGSHLLAAHAFRFR